MQKYISLVFVVVVALGAFFYFTYLSNAPTLPGPAATSTPQVATSTPATTGTQATSTPSTSSGQVTSTKPISKEITYTAYLTAYGWPDNTPPGSGAVSNPLIHVEAGGIGTYNDPITLAVGHSYATGKDVLDYKAGTTFYIPNLRKYFIVEDTCGDGATPELGPCHTGYQGHPWLDLWVGGQYLDTEAIYDCQSAITGLYTVIQHPNNNYAVASGEIASAGGCAKQFGNKVVKK